MPSGSARRRRAASPSPSSGRSASPAARGSPAKSASEVAAAEAKRSKLVTRVVWGGLLFVYLLFVLWRGHGFVCINVLLCEVEIFREMVNVRYNNRERDIPWFRSLQWAWFCVAVVYLYGDLAISLCMRGAPVIWGHDRSFYEHWHKKLTFLSYSTVFVITVLSMKKGFYRYQMNQLAWTLLTLVMVVAQMHSMILNVIEGLFWFVIPTMLVIVNDSAAYFVGFTTGRRFIDHEKHPFLKLSPNKTWEGFIGGGLLTIIAGFYLPLLFAGSEWLVCRPEGLSLWSSEPLTCEPAPQFSPATYSLPMLENTTITCLPVQLQVLMLAVFASVVAPFGGFFASAIKRAYDAKDFDTFIPGHGGLMDRLDCQFIMGLCTCTFCHTVLVKTASVAQLLQEAAQLSPDQQQQLLIGLQKAMSSGAPHDEFGDA